MKDLINGQPEQDIEHCATCVNDEDSVEICVLRNCKYAIAKLIDRYESKQSERMTNFEWMTQDEQTVAIWLSEIGCDTCPAWTYCKKRSETVDESCVETLCNWLKCDFKREQIGAEIYKI